MRTMRAKYAGSCTNCGGGIKRGDEIEWSRTSGAQHVDCGYDVEAAAEATFWRQREDVREIRFGSDEGAFA
jgi:hypothetical protein